MNAARNLRTRYELRERPPPRRIPQAEPAPPKSRRGRGGDPPLPVSKKRRRQSRVSASAPPMTKRIPMPTNVIRSVALVLLPDEETDTEHDDEAQSCSPPPAISVAPEAEPAVVRVDAPCCLQAAIAHAPLAGESLALEDHAIAQAPPILLPPAIISTSSTPPPRSESGGAANAPESASGSPDRPANNAVRFAEEPRAPVRAFGWIIDPPPALPPPLAEVLPRCDYYQRFDMRPPYAPCAACFRAHTTTALYMFCDGSAMTLCFECIRMSRSLHSPPVWELLQQCYAAYARVTADKTRAVNCRWR